MNTCCALLEVLKHLFCVLALAVVMSDQSQEEVPTDAQLLRAIAQATHGSRCAWAPVSLLCERLGTSRQSFMTAVNRSSWWCDHINGFVFAKPLDALFQNTPSKLKPAAPDMLALANSLSSGLEPWVPRKVLVM